jgi:hypothetical protein
MLASAPMLISSKDWKALHRCYEALCRFLGILLLNPRIASLADRVYGIVARRRDEIATWFGLQRHCEVEPAPPVEFDDSIRRRIVRALRLSREGVALFFLVVCSVAWASDMNDESRPPGLQGMVYRIVAYPRLFQRWRLFAPEPPKRPGKLVAEAQTANGEKLDRLTGSPPHQGERIAGADERPEPLMLAYFTNISQPSRSTYVNELREYLRRVGDRRAPGDKLVWFNVDWIEAPISAPEGESPPELAEVSMPRRITSGPCDAVSLVARFR